MAFLFFFGWGGGRLPFFGCLSLCMDWAFICIRLVGYIYYLPRTDRIDM